MRRVLLAVLLLLLALPLGGCVERKFLIRSWPEGARVLVNGTPVGATPVEIPFDHYGTVRLEALAVDADGDGWADYRPLTVAHELSAPWYQWFPFDFFSDNLWPGTLVVRREALLSLEPALTPERDGDVEAMRRAAGALRIRAERVRAEEETAPQGGGK